MEYDELLKQGLIDVVMSQDGQVCYVRDIHRVGDYNLVQALKVIMYYHRDIVVVVRGLATSDFFYINQKIALTDRYLSLLKGLWNISECDEKLLSPQEFWTDYPGDYFNAFGRLAWMYVNARPQYNVLFGNHNIRDLYASSYVRDKLEEGYNSFDDILVRCKQLRLPDEIRLYIKLYVDEDWVSEKSVDIDSLDGRHSDWSLTDKDKLHIFKE